MPSRPLKGLLIALAALALLGFADASYLTADHYIKLPLPCSLTGGCDRVLGSQYATIGAIPISLIGVLYYLTLLAIAAYLLSVETPEAVPAKTALGITGVGLAVSLFLLYLQIFVIHALCMYCLGSATLSLLLFTVSILLVRRLRVREGNAQ